MVVGIDLVFASTSIGAAVRVEAFTILHIIGIKTTFFLLGLGHARPGHPSSRRELAHQIPSFIPMWQIYTQFQALKPRSYFNINFTNPYVDQTTAAYQ